MRRCLCLLVAGLILTQAVSLRPLSAADPSAGAAAASPNAAVIYWQACAAMFRSMRRACSRCRIPCALPEIRSRWKKR